MLAFRYLFSRAQPVTQVYGYLCGCLFSTCFVIKSNSSQNPDNSGKSVSIHYLVLPFRVFFENHLKDLNPLFYLIVWA